MNYFRVWLLLQLLAITASSGAASEYAAKSTNQPTLPEAGASSEPLEKSFDLIVVGSPPAGVAMAVSAAREGLSVLLSNHTTPLGGMLSNGLGVWDTVTPAADLPC